MSILNEEIWEGIEEPQKSQMMAIREDILQGQRLLRGMGPEAEPYILSPLDIDLHMLVVWILRYGEKGQKHRLKVIMDSFTDEPQTGQKRGQTGENEA